MVAYRPISDLRDQLNNCQTLVADGHDTLGDAFYYTAMKNIQRLQNDIDELRSQIRRMALIPLVSFLFIVGIVLSSAEESLDFRAVSIISFIALVISTSLYKLIMERHPLNARVRVLTKELLDY